MCKKLNFFWGNFRKRPQNRRKSDFLLNFGAENRTLQPICHAQKLHFFWTFFRKRPQNLGNSRFLGNFGLIYGTYSGHIFKIGLHKNCKKLQKIELFLKLLLIYGEIRAFCPISRDICGTLGQIGCAQKLHFFSIFGSKSAYLLGNKRFLAEIMAHSGVLLSFGTCTKIAKNWTFFQIFEQKVLKT